MTEQECVEAKSKKHRYDGKYEEYSDYLVIHDVMVNDTITASIDHKSSLKTDTFDTVKK